MFLPSLSPPRDPPAKKDRGPKSLSCPPRAFLAPRARTQKPASKLTRKSAQNGAQTGPKMGPQGVKNQVSDRIRDFVASELLRNNFFGKIAFVWKAVLMPEPCVLHGILNIAPLAPKGHATRTRTPIAVECDTKNHSNQPQNCRKNDFEFTSQNRPPKNTKKRPIEGPKKS